MVTKLFRFLSSRLGCNAISLLFHWTYSYSFFKRTFPSSLSLFPLFTREFRIPPFTQMLNLLLLVAMSSPLSSCPSPQSSPESSAPPSTSPSGELAVTAGAGDTPTQTSQMLEIDLHPRTWLMLKLHAFQQNELDISGSSFATVVNDLVLAWEEKMKTRMIKTTTKTYTSMLHDSSWIGHLPDVTKEIDSV